MIVGKLVWLQAEDPNEDISVVLTIWEQLSTSVLFKDILEAISLILHCRATCWLELEYSTFTMWEAHSISIQLSTMDWFLEVRIRAEDKLCSSNLLIQEMKVTKIQKILTSLSAPRLARYIHRAWKKHQDAIFWVDIDLGIKEGLVFYQTRSNAIIYQGVLPASCIVRAERLKNGETLYERQVSSSTTNDLFDTRSQLD